MNLLAQREEELRKKIWMAIRLIERERIFMHSESFELTVENKSFRIPLVLGMTILNAIVGNGSMILYGGYGYGKTTLLKYLGRVLTGYPIDYIESTILRANPQLTEEKIVGRLELGDLLKEGKETIVWRKFTKSFWKIIDEINRLSPAAQDVILSLLGEGIAKYFDETYISKYYVLYATLNPRDVGTFPVGLPVLDRFGIALIIKAPHIDDMDAIIDTPDERVLKKEIPALLSIEDLVDIWGFVEAVKIDEEARMFINVLTKELSLCDRVDKEAGVLLTLGSKVCMGCPFEMGDSICKYSYTPLSVRAQKDLVRYSKALAWLLGLDSVTLSIVVKLAPYIIWHRLKFAEKYVEEHGYNKFLFAKKIVENALRLYVKNMPLIQTFQKLKSGELDAKMIDSIKKASRSDLLIKFEIEPYVDMLITREYLDYASKLSEALKSKDKNNVIRLLEESKSKLSSIQHRFLENALESYLRRNMRTIIIPTKTLEKVLDIIKEKTNVDIPNKMGTPSVMKINFGFESVDIIKFSDRQDSPTIIKIYTLDNDLYESILKLLRE